MNKKFFDALSLLGDENSVETEIIVEKVRSALLKAIIPYPTKSAPSH